MTKTGACAIYDIRPIRNLNSNLAKSRLPIMHRSVVKSFGNFSQSTAVPCSVQNSQTIWQLEWMIWANEISRDLSLKCVSNGYPILHRPQNIDQTLNSQNKHPSFIVSILGKMDRTVTRPTIKLKCTQRALARARPAVPLSCQWSVA